MVPRGRRGPALHPRPAASSWVCRVLPSLLWNVRILHLPRPPLGRCVSLHVSSSHSAPRARAPSEPPTGTEPPCSLFPALCPQPQGGSHPLYAQNSRELPSGLPPTEEARINDGHTTTPPASSPVGVTVRRKKGVRKQVKVRLWNCMKERRFS